MSRSIASPATRALPRGVHLCTAQLRQLTLAFALLFVLQACSAGAPERALTSVEPTSFRNDTLTTVTVTGKGFSDVPSVTLSSIKKVPLKQTYRVLLAAGSEIAFKTTDVRRTPPDRLEFDVEPGTAPGTYDVRVEPPLGAALVLPGALTILPSSDLDAGAQANGDAAQGGGDAALSTTDFALSLEDAPGGAGAQLDPEKLYKPGAQLDCYAVARAKDGAYKEDVTVGWKVSGATTSVPDAGPSAHVLLDAVGDVTITAEHETLGRVSATVHVVPGPAVRLTLSPDSRSIQAGDPPLIFSVSAQDADGNPTQDYGELTFSLADGTLTGFEAASATLTPKLIGAGHVHVTSSLGLEQTSGLIEVTPGPLVRLIVLPDTMQLSADDAPVQFVASGVDAFNNSSDMLGDLTWTVDSGPITSLSSTGQLDPVKAGTGKIRVTSSLANGGVSAVSGDIEIAPGHAAALSVMPGTWHGIVGGAPQQFAATGSDADGNATTDLGTLSYSVTGPIQGVNASSGVLTPTTAGQGTVKAMSSYGASGWTQNVVISSPSATVTITALRLANIFQGATTRIELDLTTNDVADALLTGLAFTFTDGNSNDLTSDYAVVPDNSNSDHVLPGSKLTLVYYVIVSPSSSTTGAVFVNVRGDAFNSAGMPVALSTVGITTQYQATFGTGLSIDAPKPPADHTCAGGRIAFSATVSNPAFGYLWSFPEGKLASSASVNDRSPSVDYSTPGLKSYAVTAQYTFLFVTYATTLPSIFMPVFVGTSSNNAADTYPTGRVVFSSPSANANVPLSSFPRANLITLDPSLPVTQCNNQPVDPTGHNVLTLFSDRQLIDPTADSDPATPGIQLQLTAQGGLPSVPLLAAASSVEGPTTLYAEYFDAQRGVTAAGDTTFNLSGDAQAPSLRFSSPASDCSGPCLKSRDPLVFQFSEPLASISPVLVDLFSGSSTCTGASTDWTGASTLRYDSAESALYVVTPTRTGVYSVRVRLPATLTDTASAKNPLPAQSRCAVFGALADVSTPATPQLVAAAPPASVFSPDGDQVADTVTWNVSVDASTTLLRLRILRAGKAISGTLLPVTQAGTYSVSWDGTDPSGRVVNNGGYAYTLEALNRAGTASSALRGVVEVSSAVRLMTLRRRQ